MKVDELKIRIDELIDFANKVLSTEEKGSRSTVETEAFHTFRSASLSFLRNTFGVEHPFFLEFDKQVIDVYTFHTKEGKGILNAARQEIYGGWIFKVKNIVSADIFSDFFEMSEYLLLEGYKDAAAVMIGSLLEERLRQIATENKIDVTITKDGKPTPKKADSLNTELYSSGIYSKLDHKNVTSWLDLRNNAAHGHYNQYTKVQVEYMFNGVNEFVSRTL